MNIVKAPLASGKPSGLASWTVRSMQVGQHVMAVLLTGAGAVRALQAGTDLAPVLVAAAALLIWHTAGTLTRSISSSAAGRLWWLLGLAVIWGFAIWVSPEFVWVAFLLWLLAGHLLTGLVAIVFSAGVYVLVVLAPILHHGTTTYANVFGPLIGGVFAFGIARGYLELLKEAAAREQLLASLTAAQREMASLQDELAAAGRHSGQLAERTRIARDIHDTVAQSLSSIRLLAHAANQAPTARQANVHRQVAQIETLASESLRDVRRIVEELTPSELEDSALVTALASVIQRFKDTSGITAVLNADEHLPALPTPVEVAFLRTAQSALANVREHSGASTVAVSVIDGGDTLRMDIVDDGQGFAAHTWEQASTPAAASSYGLRFMRERLRELGGGLEVESAPGEGTAISAFVPISGMHLEENS